MIILSLNQPSEKTNTLPRTKYQQISSILHNSSAYDILSSLNSTNTQFDIIHNKLTDDILPKDILHKVLSSRQSNPKSLNIKDNYVTIDGKKYKQYNMSKTYHISTHKRQKYVSLADRRANGGIAGKQKDNIMGIDNHQLIVIHLITAGGVSQLYLGPVILIFYQYTHYSKGKSIHSPVHLKAFNNDVNDKSIKLGSLQQGKPLDGYTFPLDFQDGLPYLPLLDHLLTINGRNYTCLRDF